MRPEAQRHLNRIGQADLVVGIPTYGNAPTVGMVIQTVLDGVGTDLDDLRVDIEAPDEARESRGRRRQRLDLEAPLVPLLLDIKSCQRGHIRQVAHHRREVGIPVEDTIVGSALRAMGPRPQASSVAKRASAPAPVKK